MVNQARLPERAGWNTQRDLAKLVVVAAVFAVSFGMLANVVGYESPWLGLLLMFYFMGLAKVAQPLFILRLPRAIRDVDPKRIDDRWFRHFGVHLFGAMLRNTPLRWLNGSVYQLRRGRNVAELQRNIESAEAIHFWAAVLFTPYIVCIGARGHLAEASLFVLVQIAFNVYPILHLRLVRARLSRIGPAHGFQQNPSRQ